jgi:hypothetical protein
MDRFLSDLTAWFAWATDTPDIALDPLMALALSIVVFVMLLVLLIVTLAPLDEPRVSDDDPYATAFGDCPPPRDTNAREARR